MGGWECSPPDVWGGGVPGPETSDTASPKQSKCYQR